MPPKMSEVPTLDIGKSIFVPERFLHVLPFLSREIANDEIIQKRVKEIMRKRWGKARQSREPKL